MAMPMFELDARPAQDAAQAYCAQIANFLTDNPDAWTKGCGARDGNGWETYPRDPSARKWCAFGLIEKFIESGPLRSVVARLLSRVVTPFNQRRAASAPSFNDRVSTNVEDVIRMFRAASYLPYVPDVTEACYPENVVLYGFGTAVEPVEVKEGSFSAAVSEIALWTLPPPAAPPLSEQALNDALDKIVPWPSIMKQLAGSMAA